MGLMPTLAEQGKTSLKQVTAPPLKKLSSLIASASRVSSRTKRNRQSSTSTVSEWQEDAWAMYDTVAELRYLATTLSRQQSMARFSVMYQDPAAPDEDPTPSEDPRISRLLNVISGHSSIFPQMIERIAVNLFVAGEAWLVGLPPEASTSTAKELPMETLEWRVFSNSEIVEKVNAETVQVTLSEDDIREFHIDSIYAIRIWQPHPRRSWEATSPCRSALPVLQQIVGLTMHTSAQIDSRLAGAGMMIVPKSAHDAIQADSDLDDPNDDQLLTDLIEVMQTSIQDRSSAAALVPILVTVPDEVTDKFKHITFDKPLDAAASDMMDQALRRFAIGQDAPPELLLGTSATNHWGAWIVREETVRSHVAPVVGLICDALTREFLWPILEDKGMEPEEALRYSVGYSIDHLIIRPQAGDDAKELYDRGALSAETLRRELGFDEADAPTDEEATQQIEDAKGGSSDDESSSVIPTKIEDPDLEMEK